MTTAAKHAPFRAHTHYCRDGVTAIYHQIEAVRCDAQKATGDGWTWAMYALLGRCEHPECPVCRSSDSYIRDRGETKTRKLALGTLAGRVDSHFGPKGLDMATVKVLATSKARRGKESPIRALTTT